MHESESTQRDGMQFGEPSPLAPTATIEERVPLEGELSFASPEAQLQRTAELLGEGAIVVSFGAAPAAVRGRLAEYIDDRVERELGVQGAPSPVVEYWSAVPEEAEERLADQLTRARRIGATGIAIALGSLARIAAPALTPEDSATLRILARVVGKTALVVLVDDADETLGGYGEPLPLKALLDMREATTPVPVPVPDLDGEHEEEVLAQAHDQVLVEDCDDEETEPEIGHGHGHVEMGCEDAIASVETHVDAPVAEVNVDADVKEAARRRATVGIPVAGRSDVWRAWAIALGAARGPQPLAAFEKLFTESYMPLAGAIAAGLDDPRALRAHDEFRRGFERSYTDAFATFGATGRRPRLVMDAFEVAAKQARLHNARTTHLLVVDAMRYDLGCLVRDEIAARAPSTASLTSESLLWSALPTTTFRQLETLARGIDALRAPAPEESSESLRGRSAETVRRMRVGSRELHKLDVVPAMLGTADHEDIAISVADAVLRHIEALPPRTLLLVIGDHGFTLDRRGRVTDGGASPEEVLVPCLAYLIAELH
jgi:hypothetical protein